MNNDLANTVRTVRKASHTLRSSSATSQTISRRETYRLTRMNFDFSTADVFENTTRAQTATTNKLSSKKTRSSHYFMQIRRSTCDRPWFYANMWRGYSQELRAAVQNTGYGPRRAGPAGGSVWSSNGAFFLRCLHQSTLLFRNVSTLGWYCGNSNYLRRRRRLCIVLGSTDYSLRL